LLSASYDPELTRDEPEALERLPLDRDQHFLAGDLLRWLGLGDPAHAGRVLDAEGCPPLALIDGCAGSHRLRPLGVLNGAPRLNRRAVVGNEIVPAAGGGLPARVTGPSRKKQRMPRPRERPSHKP